VSAEHDAMSRDSEQSRLRERRSGQIDQGFRKLTIYLDEKQFAQSVKDLCVVFDSEYIVKHISSMSDKTKGLGRDRCRNTKKDRSTWQ